MSIKHLLGIVIAALPAIAWAQSEHTSVKGKVLDSIGKGLENAQVVLTSMEKGSKRNDNTDSTGRFSITHIPKGKYRLTISAIGYKPYSTNVTLNKAEETFQYSLQSNINALSAVTVNAAGNNQYRVQQIRESGFNVNVVDANEYANFSTDINQVLKKTTGVLIRESGGMGSNFTFQINGLAAKIYIDDIPMDQYGASMTLNNIPVNLIDRVEVYKGVVPAQLGSDAMGGAVNIITKQRTKTFVDASYSYGSFNTHQASLTGGFRNKKGFKLRASGFYNHSDNDYTMYSDVERDIKLEVAKNDKMVVVDKAKRFYDQYTSGMAEIELGYEKVKWADWFTIGLTHSQNKKQNQIGASINTVNGGYWSENSYWMPTIKYRKDNFLVPGLYANLYANYSYDQYDIKDTATQNYDWSGGWIHPLAYTTPDSVLILRDSINSRYIYKNYSARANFNYKLDKANNHSLNFNYTFSTTQQKSFDYTLTGASQDRSGLPGRLSKHIAGLAWQGQWLNKKLISVTSVKYYGLQTYKVQDERVFDNHNEVIGGQFTRYTQNKNYFSGSLALRYRITPEWGIKTSVERGYKLPEITQLFGDGMYMLPNMTLKPERSDNINIGTFYNRFFGNHFIDVDVSAFYRNAKDFINTRTSGQRNDFYQNENLPGVLLYGIEAEARYGYKDIVGLTINGSYNKALDNWKYTDASNTQISLTYREQLANRPTLYANSNLSLAKRDLLGKGSRIQFNWQYQFIHWYYLTWAKMALPGSKSHIPAQFVHSATVTYSWHKDMYNVSFEARNLTDERVYDNFRLQKPGRAFYVKFRVSIM